MVTEEGLLAIPTTSNDDLLDIGEIDVNAVDETNDEEESNLSEPDPKPSQRSPKDAKKKKDKRENRRGTTSYKQYKPQDQKRNQSRKRRYSGTLSEERIIEQSEETLKALNRHSQRGTCPKTLQYKARARIRADEAFKTDIKRIRKTTEQEVVNALIRYHERRIAESKKITQKAKETDRNCKQEIKGQREHSCQYFFLTVSKRFSNRCCRVRTTVSTNIK